MKNRETVAFLLPTNRPYEPYSRRVIESIRSANNPQEYDYKIHISTSNTDIPAEKDIELHKDNKLGPLWEFNTMAFECKAEYIYVITDDHSCPPNIFDAIDFLKSDIFQDRRNKITTLASGGPCYIQWDDPAFPFTKTLPRWLCMRFPVLNRKTLNRLGFIFHPVFKSHWADNFLGYFLGMNDEPGIECSHVELYEFEKQLGQTTPYYYQQDYNTHVRLCSNYVKGDHYVY